MIAFRTVLDCSVYHWKGSSCKPTSIVVPRTITYKSARNSVDLKLVESNAKFSTGSKPSFQSVFVQVGAVHRRNYPPKN